MYIYYGTFIAPLAAHSDSEAATAGTVVVAEHGVIYIVVILTATSNSGSENVSP